MSEKKWLTLSFWAAVLSGVGMVAVALGVIPQEEADVWIEMLLAFVAAVLPVIVLITGWGNERATTAQFLPEETPAWLTGEFWMAIVTTVIMVLIAAGLLAQEQGEQWKQALGPLIAAILTIAAYIRAKTAIRTGRLYGTFLRSR